MGIRPPPSVVASLIFLQEINEIKMPTIRAPSVNARFLCFTIIIYSGVRNFLSAQGEQGEATCLQDRHRVVNTLLNQILHYTVMFFCLLLW